MSRIGKKPVNIPKGLSLSVNGDVLVFSKGKESSSLDTKGNVSFNVEGDVLAFSPKSNSKADRAFWGTYRALASNIVEGLSKGFEKKLEINGVGYKANIKGKKIELSLGFSHPINYDVPDGIVVSLEKNVLSVKGSDKQVVGQVASEIRAFRPPEPYKGKGVKYLDEKILRKAGKTAKK